MAKRIRTSFAENGDRTVVQDVPPADGTVNYSTGYPAQYSLDIVSDPTARRVNRDRFNQIMHDITSNIQEWQNQLYPAYVAPSVNGGVAIPYRKGMVVTFGGVSRISLVDNNTTQPDNNTNWSDAFNLPVAVGGTGADNAADARTNLGIQAATELIAGLTRIATQAEVNAGSVANAHVTPATLASLTATGIRRGLIEIAGDSEVIDGTDSEKAVVPSSLLNLFSGTGRQSLTASGYQVLPGGLILQWGTGTASVVADQDGFLNVLPISYPNANFGVLATHVGVNAGTTNIITRAASPGSFRAISANNIAVPIVWFSLGH